MPKRIKLKLSQSEETEESSKLMMEFPCGPRKLVLNLRFWMTRSVLAQETSLASTMLLATILASLGKVRPRPVQLGPLCVGLEPEKQPVLQSPIFRRITASKTKRMLKQ